MSRRKVDYRKVLQLAAQLTPMEQAQLIDELREHLLGFGMWKDRKDLRDIESYVEELRAEESKHPDGSPKTPKEFLAELEAWEA